VDFAMTCSRGLTSHTGHTPAYLNAKVVPCGFYLVEFVAYNSTSGTMYLVAFFQKKLSEIASVLASYSCY